MVRRFPLLFFIIPDGVMAFTVIHKLISFVNTRLTFWKGSNTQLKIVFKKQDLL